MFSVTSPPGLSRAEVMADALTRDYEMDKGEQQSEFFGVTSGTNSNVSADPEPNVRIRNLSDTSSKSESPSGSMLSHKSPVTGQGQARLGWYAAPMSSPHLQSVLLPYLMHESHSPTEPQGQPEIKKESSEQKIIEKLRAELTKVRAELESANNMLQMVKQENYNMKLMISRFEERVGETETRTMSVTMSMWSLTWSAPGSSTQ